MKRLHTFEQFISKLSEGTVSPPDSNHEIEDMITHDGTEISGEEILGIILSCEGENEVEDKLYDKFGQTAFTTEDISKVLAHYNKYKAEIKKKEQEEKDKEKEGGDEGGGDDLGDLTKGL